MSKKKTGKAIPPKEEDLKKALKKGGRQGARKDFFSLLEKAIKFGKE